MHRTTPTLRVSTGALLALLASALWSGPAEAGPAQRGEACGPGRQCAAGLSCTPFVQKCEGPGRVDEPCGPGRPCASGLTCVPGVQRCKGPGQRGDACGPGRQCAGDLVCDATKLKCRPRGAAGDTCNPTRPCQPGLHCDASSFTCKGAGAVGQSCNPSRPCGAGLSCHPGAQRCYHQPRHLSEPCGPTEPCKDDLLCSAIADGPQRCYEPADEGESCDKKACGGGLVCAPTDRGKVCRRHTGLGERCRRNSDCEDGMVCSGVFERCAPKKIDLDAGRAAACNTFLSEGQARFAKDVGRTVAFGTGAAAAALSGAADETGVVYGPNGEFGCYVAHCDGALTDATVAVYAVAGFFSKWTDFAGHARLVSQGASVPFVEIGFTTGQVLNMQDKLIGTVDSLSNGVGIMPIQAGVMGCVTHVIGPGEDITTLKQKNDASLLQFGVAKEPVRIESFATPGQFLTLRGDKLSVAPADFDSKAQLWTISDDANGAKSLTSVASGAFITIEQPMTIIFDDREKACRSAKPRVFRPSANTRLRNEHGKGWRFLLGDDPGTSALMYQGNCAPTLAVSGTRLGIGLNRDRSGEVIQAQFHVDRPEQWTIRLASAVRPPAVAVEEPPVAPVRPAPRPAPRPALSGPLPEGEYRLRVKATGRWLHADDLGDKVISTRHQPKDDYTVFRLELVAKDTYRIRVKASGRYVRADEDRDQLLSTRVQRNDAQAHFRFVPLNDRVGGYRVVIVQGGRRWHVDGGNDRLVSTRYQPDDAFTRFDVVRHRGW